MNKKKEKTEEKKLEGVVVKPEESRDLIKKNLMEMFKKQGIKVKRVKPKTNQLQCGSF